MVYRFVHPDFKEWAAEVDLIDKTQYNVFKGKSKKSKAWIQKRRAGRWDVYIDSIFTAKTPSLKGALGLIAVSAGSK